MEILDVFDEAGNLIGKEERKKVHELGLWHIHVGAWLMNKQGELLIQKRAMAKKVNAGKWTRTGGHVDSGETPVTGIKREVAEEVGINLDEQDFILIDMSKRDSTAKYVDLKNRTFIYSYFAYTDAKIEDCVLQEEEVSEVKYITIEDMIDICEKEDDNYTFSKWKDEYIGQTIDFLKQKREEILKK